MLKGSSKYETAENYALVGVLFGGLVLSVGIVLTIFSESGMPAVLAMIGSLIAFLFTIILILIWIVKDFQK